MVNVKVAILEKDGVEYDTPVEYDLAQAINEIVLNLSGNATKTEFNYQNSSNTTWVIPTEYVLNLLAGKTYEVDFNGIVSTSSASSGISVSLQGNANYSSFVGLFEAPINNNTIYQSVIINLNQAVQSTSFLSSNNKYKIKVRVTFVCTTSGTLALAFRSETNNNMITLFSGSNVIVREI